MAVEREDIQYRGHRIIANAASAMVYPDKHSFETKGLKNALSQAKAWIDTKYRERSKKRRASHIGTAEDYVDALSTLKLAEHEQTMLVAHRNAKDRKMSASEISRAAGWDGVTYANSHYGYLAKRIALQIGLSITDNDDHAWTEAIAEYDEKAGKWEMHEEVAAAMDRLNIK